jgi:hypothetical protein
LRFNILYLLLPFLPLIAGCAAGYIANEVAGTPTVEAEYVPPKEPTLVLVENYSISAGPDVDCDRLGRLIEQDLTENKVVPLVDDAALSNLRDRDLDAYRKMSIAAIGQAIGAKQVIYVNVLEYGSDSPIGGDIVKWKARVKVKVVDTSTGASRWPLELAEGEPLEVETDYKESDHDSGSEIVRDTLNKNLADKVDKLFHSWQKEHDDPEDYEQ